MRAIEEILACTDLTRESQEAVECAAWLATRRGASLDIVTVIESGDHHHGYLVEDIEHQRYADMEKRLRALAEDLARRRGIETRHHVRVGDIIDEVMAVASERSIDLLVCGRHNRSAWDRVTLGSVAAQLLYRVPCDVLIAEDGLDTCTLRIGVATDCSPASRDAAMRAIEVARHGKLGELHLIHAYELSSGYSKTGLSHDEMTRVVAQRHEEELRAFIADLDAEGLTIHTRLAEGSATSVIEEAVTSLDLNLLICGARGRTGPAALMLGRTSRRIVHQLGISVWVVRASAERHNFLSALMKVLDPGA